MTEEVVGCGKEREDQKIGFTREALEQAVIQEKRERAGKCEADLKAALEKYRCRLVAHPFFTDDGRVDARLIISPE